MCEDGFRSYEFVQYDIMRDDLAVGSLFIYKSI